MKTYISPKTKIVVIRTHHHLMDASKAGQEGLTGVSQEEYTGGTVKWSRSGGDILDDDE